MGEVHNFARLVDRVQDRFPNVVVRASTGEHEPSLLDERSGRLFVGAPAVEGVSTASD
jgi:hypothetical protein